MSETARQRGSTLQRSLTRTTLQPSVHDFNGNIINKSIDEDSMVWLVGKNTSKIVPSTEYSFPVPASFRKGGAFGPVHWESARPTSLPPSLSSTPIPSSWAGEMHRRHVVRTARARARLSPKQRMTDRVAPTSPSTSCSMYEDAESAFSLSLPFNGQDGVEFDAKLTTRTPSKQENTARSRPATTGRYFDTSNGLRNSRSRTAWRSRPSTAGQWAAGGPGLRIQKLTLRSKEWEYSLPKGAEGNVTMDSLMMQYKAKA